MIEGHGDDLHRYSGIQMNFSSNIYARADLSRLEEYLCSRMQVIRSYPEPSASSLERLIARQHGISPDCVLVTSGAVDAVRSMMGPLAGYATPTTPQVPF